MLLMLLKYCQSELVMLLDRPFKSLMITRATASIEKFYPLLQISCSQFIMDKCFVAGIVQPLSSAAVPTLFRDAQVALLRAFFEAPPVLSLL